MATTTPTFAGLDASAIQKVSAPVINTFTTQVDPSQTTEGILGRLVQENSPYLQRAQSLALQTANARGLLNSSIAAGSGTAAAIDAALQIAAPDANLYSQTRLANMAAENNTRQFNAQNQLSADTFNAGNVYDANKFNATQANAFNLSQQELAQRDSQFAANLDMQKAQLAQSASQFDRNLAQSGSQFDRNLAQSGSQFDRNLAQNANQFSRNLSQTATLQQSSQQAQQDLARLQAQLNTQSNTSSTLNSLYQAYMDASFKIDADPNLSAEAKLAMKQNALEVVNGYSKLKSLNLDLNFSNVAPSAASAAAAAPAQNSAPKSTEKVNVSTTEGYNSLADLLPRN